MNYTLKFPNWRRASVAAARHVTAFFSPWRCCSCLPSFCPSDCHRKWHFMHSWTTLSKGLCIHLLRVFDVKLGRSREGESRGATDSQSKQHRKEILNLLDLKKGEAFLLSYLHQCILTLDVLLGIVIIGKPQHFMQVCQHGGHKQTIQNPTFVLLARLAAKRWVRKCWNEFWV